MSRGEGECTQLSLFHPAQYLLPQEPFPCDTCGYDVVGCCDYPDTPDDYCVMGDKWKPPEGA